MDKSKPHYPNIQNYLEKLNTDAKLEIDVDVEIQRIRDNWLNDTINWIEHRFTTNSTVVSEKMLEYSVRREPIVSDNDSIPKNSILKMIRSSGDVEDVLFRYIFADNVSFIFLRDVTTTDEYKLERYTYQKNKDFFFKVSQEYENNLAKDRPMLAELLSST